MAHQHQVLIASRQDAGGPLTADGELTPLQTDELGQLRVLAGGESLNGQTILPTHDTFGRRESEQASALLLEIRDLLFESLSRLAARPTTLDAIRNEPPSTTTLTLASDVEVLGTPGATRSLYIRRITLSNTSATLTRLDLKEGSAGTVRYSMALAASGGGVRESFTPYWRLPPNIGLFGALSTGVTDVRVNVDYYIA